MISLSIKVELSYKQTVKLIQLAILLLMLFPA